MTKPKKPEELTDEAAIRRIFPKEVVREVKREAKESDERPKKRTKPMKSEVSV